MKKPLSDNEEITKATYDKYGKEWDKKYQDDRFWSDEIGKLHKLKNHGRLIDIGCGAGRETQELVALGFDYVGTDISETLLKIAREKNPDQKFINQSLYDLSFAEKFDAFWCTAVLLHIPKERMSEALTSIRSVLKTGAAGFITIKKGTGDRIEDYEIEGKLLRRYYSYWSEEEFTKALNGSSFKVLDYSYRPANARQLWHCFLVKAD